MASSQKNRDGLHSHAAKPVSYTLMFGKGLLTSLSCSSSIVLYRSSLLRSLYPPKCCLFAFLSLTSLGIEHILLELLVCPFSRIWMKTLIHFTRN